MSHPEQSPSRKSWQTSAGSSASGHLPQRERGLRRPRSPEVPPQPTTLPRNSSPEPITLITKSPCSRRTIKKGKLGGDIHSVSHPIYTSIEPSLENVLRPVELEQFGTCQMLRIRRVLICNLFVTSRVQPCYPYSLHPPFRIEGRGFSMPKWLWQGLIARCSCSTKCCTFSFPFSLFQNTHYLPFI